MSTVPCHARNQHEKVQAEPAKQMTVFFYTFFFLFFLEKEGKYFSHTLVENTTSVV
jgi:hypothetical protein